MCVCVCVCGVVWCGVLSYCAQPGIVYSLQESANGCKVSACSMWDVRMSVEGCMIGRGIHVAVEGCNVSVGGCNVSVEGCNVSVEGCNVSVEGCNVSVEGCNVSVEGAMCQLRGAMCQLRGTMCHLREIRCQVRGIVWQMCMDSEVWGYRTPLCSVSALLPCLESHS